LLLFFSVPTPPIQLHTLSLHDALPISGQQSAFARTCPELPAGWRAPGFRLNSETDVSVGSGSAPQVVPVKTCSRYESSTAARGFVTASLCAALTYGCVTGTPAQPPRDVPAAFEHGATSGGGQWPAQD